MAYDGTLKFDTSMNTSGFQKDAGKLGDIVKGLGVFKIIEQGMKLVAASIDSAVSRYDTLNRFPKIMQQMGFSAEDTGISMKKLSDGIQGLPTSLDQIVGFTQRIASMTGNLTGAADVTLALNNAFLASGSSSDAAARGMEQYMQIISRGKPEMEDWKTLQETMTYALQQVAESFGFAGTSATRDFYAALQSGEITVEQMNARFVELSTATGGFAEMAKTSTGGIATAFTNMKTRIAAGVTEVIAGIDWGFSQTRFKSIENIINSTGTAIKNILTKLAGAFEFAARNIEPITVGVIAFSAAWKGVQLVSYISQLGSITKALAAMTPKLAAATAAKLAETKATLSACGQEILLTTAIIAESVAKGANTVVTNLSTAADNGNVLAKIALAVATKVAAAATWLFNAALAANPIGLAIIAVVALTAAIVGLVAWLSSSSAEYKKQKKELEELTDAHEEYNKQLDEDQTAAEQTIAKTKAQSDANSDLVTSLRGLMATNDKAGSNNAAIAQTIDQLNKSVDGLGLSYDETTGKLSANIDEVEAYVKAQGQLNTIKAQEDEYNRLLGEQLDLQAKIRVEEERQKDLAQQLDDKVISEREYNKLIKSSNELLKEYGATETTLAVDVQAAHAAINQSAKDSATAQINAFNAVNGARNAEGKNLKQLANQYGMTTDQILAEMQEQGLSMEAWSAKKAEMFTKEGQSLQGVATQWGMTSAEVQSRMDEMGMSLDEFAQHMEDTHTKEGLSLDDLAAKWGTTTEAIKAEMDNMGLSMREWSEQQQAAWEDYEESVKAHAEGVVNSFKEIPGEYDKSAQEMLEILINNKARYAEWETTMEEITRQLGPTAAEEFAKLGPEATSAMQEILGSAELLDQYRETFGVKIDETTGLAVENWNDPNFIGAPSAAIDTSAQMVTENTALDTATVDTMESAKTKAMEVDFSEVGQNIAADIVGGLKGADVTGAMNSITAAITNNTGRVTSAITSMSTAVQTALRNMKTQAVTTATQMMTAINSAIVSRTGTVRASITSMGNGVVAALNAMKMQAANVTMQMMTEINSSIISRTGTVRASATAAANSVVDGLRGMVSGGINVAENMMDGIGAAMDRKAPYLYDKARSIANNIAGIMANALDVHSPSRVMIRLFENVMMGMDGMSGMLFREAESIADGITDRLTISPSVANVLADQLRRVTEANPLGGITLAPEAVSAGAGGGSVYSPTLVQNITTPKPLSPSEMTKEGQDLLRRSRWQLP
ncbi:MAG: tape measure protein [Clostridia bacterium]